MNYLIYFNLFMSLLACSSPLVLEGKWDSRDNFFLFLSKFGFQKTNPHEGASSEGFIFGNITALNKEDGSSTSQPSGTSLPKVGATLVLLPRQFFFNFYGNSSAAALDSPESYDKICQAMFKDVLTEAYDAHCHDEGREDFMRHVPCPADQLCLDEDNPDNVIPHSQLTYAIKDINNPRFWYLSLVACGLNESCGWQYSGPISVSYHLTLVNGKPPAKDHDFFAYHFSCEQQDVGELVVICLLLYVFLLLPLQFHATYKMRLRVLEVFLCVLCLQTLGLVFATAAQVIMGVRGRWVVWLAASGQVCTLLCEAGFLLLLVLLARGWAVTATTGHHTRGLYLIWGTYTAVTLALYVWNLVMVPPMSDSYQYGAWLGIFALVLRGALTGWYLWELRSTMLTQHHQHTLNFLLQLGAASLVWLVYLPVVALVALQVSPLWRPKLLQGFRYTADLLAHLFMAYTLYPRRSHPYVTLATTEDNCDELDLLDQAPQVLHRRRCRGDSRSSLSVNFEGDSSAVNGDFRLEYTNLLDADETVQFDRLNGRARQAKTGPLESISGPSERFVSGSFTELPDALDQTEDFQYGNNFGIPNRPVDKIEKIIPLLESDQFSGAYSNAGNTSSAQQRTIYPNNNVGLTSGSENPSSFEFQIDRNDRLSLTNDEQYFDAPYDKSGSTRAHASSSLIELDNAERTSPWSPELGRDLHSASNDEIFDPNYNNCQKYPLGVNTGHKVAVRGDGSDFSYDELDNQTSGGSDKFAAELNRRLMLVPSTASGEVSSSLAPAGELSPLMLSDESDSELLVVVQEKKKQWPQNKY